MDATTTTATQLITCDGCGTQVPFADSYYVDGAGQLCTTNCTTPIPETSPTSSRPSEGGGEVVVSARAGAFVL